MPSPRWRKRWKTLRRARSPIMLSLNLPQILIPPHAYHRGSGGRIKRRPALPKRAALNRRDHAKITSPAQRHGGPKPSISAGICVGGGGFLYTPKNDCRRGAAALFPCPARPETLGLTYQR